MAGVEGTAILEVGEAVRLAVAPVFLLSGVGVTLTLLTNRLARVVDRARALEATEGQTPDKELHELKDRVFVLALRARLLSRAIALCTLCALLVSMVVVALFVAALMGTRLATVISVLFIVAMFNFIGGLLFFLREIFLATRTLRIGLREARRSRS